MSAPAFGTPHPRRRPGPRRKGGGGLQAPAPERFAKLYAVQANGCWEWTGCLNSKGYGSFCVGGKGKSQLAHRWSYSHFVEAIPAGLTIDHLCRNRRCVNPAHLEAVTNAENIRRHVVGLLAAKRLIAKGLLPLLTLGLLLLVGCASKEEPKPPCVVGNRYGQLVLTCSPGSQCKSEVTPKSLVILCIPEEKVESPTTPTKTEGKL